MLPTRVKSKRDCFNILRKLTAIFLQLTVAKFKFEPHMCVCILHLFSSFALHFQKKTNQQENRWAQVWALRLFDLEREPTASGEPNTTQQRRKNASTRHHRMDQSSLSLDQWGLCGSSDDCYASHWKLQALKNLESDQTRSYSRAVPFVIKLGNLWRIKWEYYELAWEKPQKEFSLLRNQMILRLLKCRWAKLTRTWETLTVVKLVFGSRTENFSPCDKEQFSHVFNFTVCCI